MTFIISLGITIYEEKGAKQMAKYKVIKSFPSSDAGYHHLVGEIYEPTKSHTRTQNLLRLGYIKEIPEQQKTVWDLKEGDRCYIIICGIKNCFANEVGWYNTAASDREIGNVFLIQEEAEKELARRKAKVILERDTKGFKPKAKEDYCHYKVRYSNVHGLFWSSEYDLDGDLYFQNREDAEASIKNHHKEWLVYLGAED